MLIKKFQTGLALALCLLFPGAANALMTLPNPYTNTYLWGDFHSYSLPLLAYQYDVVNGGGTGPGNPFYVPSGPGQISSDIVVMTGTNSVPATTNFPNMDNAYPTPNGDGIPTFSTAVTSDPSPTFSGDMSSTWDAQLSAFTAYLGVGNTPIFFFNNNDTGTAGEQYLKAWGQVIISGAGKDSIYFDFTNTPNGGAFGGDPSSYDSPGVWEPSANDYVLSGLEVCVDTNGVPQACDSTQDHTIRNDNLGQNQAVYANISLELNDLLAAWVDPLDHTYDGYTNLSINIRLAEINNGYEQLFIMPGLVDIPPPTVVPEPSTIVLMLTGVFGLLIYQRRKRNS